MESFLAFVSTRAKIPSQPSPCGIVAPPCVQMLPFQMFPDYTEIGGKITSFSVKPPQYQSDGLVKLSKVRGSPAIGLSFAFSLAQHSV